MGFDLLGFLILMELMASIYLMVYCVNLFDKERITKEVERAKKISDVRIVSAHWGDDTTLPQIQCNKIMQIFSASLGVDVIIGGHPQCDRTDRMD